MSIVFTNSSNSGPQSTSTLSCVMTCGTLTQNKKSSGVRADQLLTVLGEGHSIERRVHFNRGKLRGVVGKKIAWIHTGRIETALPAVCRESGSTEKDSR